MQAVILAGGLGKRLGDLTKHVPKAMVPIAGKPFLHHVIQLLKRNGIVDIVICIGYLGWRVKEFFGDGETMGINIKYSEEGDKLLGTGGALKQAQNMLADYFLVLNGDTYLPVNYGELEREFLKLGKKALMVVYNNEDDTGVKNNVALDDALRVARFDKEHVSPELKYVEAGAIMLRREVLDLIQAGIPISLEEGVYQHLIERKEMAAFISPQRFYDIGTPGQQAVFEQFIRKGAI